MGRLTPPIAGSPCHRLGRAPRRRWWRTLLSFACLNVVGLVFAAVVALVLIEGPGSDLVDASGSAFEQAWELAFELLLISLTVPAVLLAVRWAERRPAGSVTSVAGRMRWRWLGACLLVAAATALLLAA